VLHRKKDGASGKFHFIICEFDERRVEGKIVRFPSGRQFPEHIVWFSPGIGVRVSEDCAFAHGDTRCVSAAKVESVGQDHDQPPAFRPLWFAAGRPERESHGS
jgi:hypothetical protein